MSEYSQFVEREAATRAARPQQSTILSTGLDRIVRGTMLQLQRTAGNQAVHNLVRHYTSRGHGSVASTDALQRTLAAIAQGPLHRKAVKSGTNAESVAGPEGGQVGGALANRIQAKRGSGAPLATRNRTLMETFFGADFGDVGIHTDVVQQRGMGSGGPLTVGLADDGGEQADWTTVSALGPDHTSGEHACRVAPAL